MGEALDLVLSDESITFADAVFLLKDHLTSLQSKQVGEVIDDLKHACSS